MIGLFGLYRAEAGAPADPGPLAAAVPRGYAVDAPPGRGAALGRAAHRLHLAGGRAESADGRIRAVACGEIFNLEAFDDLGAGLTNAAELVLRLAGADGLDRLRDANGQFCAALYDEARHRLTLITDRLATHALHLWRRDGEAVFATQLHTLIGDPRVPRRADPLALAQLFTMQRTVGRITPLAGVEALPAACILEIDRDGLRERRYWALQWRRPGFTLADGAARLAQGLRAAVGRQLSGAKAGLLLSGGVDSRMILAAAGANPPSCWTTASFADNPELALAKRVAALFGAEHHALLVRPEDTFDCLEPAVIAAGGLYPASTPVAAFMPAVAEGCAVALSGHGLDYTLRGYYLPARFAKIAGSRTRLPALRPVPARPSGRYLLENLRQGPPRETVRSIIAPARRQEWWEGQAAALEEALAPWLDGDDPYNAWDAFILHNVSKHYAFTAMMAVRAALDLRLPAFDNDVFEVYLSMPPDWRCRGRMTQLALRHLSPQAARMPNANTGFRADLHPWAEIAALMGRGAARRLGLARRPGLPSASHSHGSWQNLDNLFRQDPAHRGALQAIRGRLDGLTFSVMSADGLAARIDEHLAGTASHGKLLRQLLTHDAWVRSFRIEGHA